MKITISQEGTSPISITVPDNDFDKLLNSILNCYYNVDKGHGKFHIKTVIDNAKYGLTKESIKNGLTKEQIYLTAALHDIGLLPHVCKTVLNTPDLSKEELRKLHHINGARIIKGLYNDKTACNKLSINHDYLRFVIGDKLENISHAIEHHRASVQQTEWLDKFIRCCDGLNNHKTILSRAWLYNKDHFPDVKDEQIIMMIKQHLTDKYLKNGYGSVMPQKWAVDKFNKEIKLLSNFLESLKEDNNSVKKLLSYINDTLNDIEKNSL